MIGGATFLVTLSLGALLLKPLFTRLAAADDRHRALINHLLRRRRAASASLRAMTIRSIWGKRESDTSSLDAEALREKLDKLNKAIVAAQIDRQGVYYLLDSSAMAQRTFAFGVSHRNVTAAYGQMGVSAPLVAAWRRGRRFLIAGADREEALERLAKRFPEDSGFVVSTLEFR